MTTATDRPRPARRDRHGWSPRHRRGHHHGAGPQRRARCRRILVDDDAGYITGAVLAVNGGLDM